MVRLQEWIVLDILGWVKMYNEVGDEHPDLFQSAATGWDGMRAFILAMDHTLAGKLKDRVVRVAALPFAQRVDAMTLLHGNSAVGTTLLPLAA